MNSTERAELFVKRIGDGTLVKRHLSNHGFNYTDGPEDIASTRFNQYLGSCGYRLMKYRIGTEAEVYRG